jgi:predicted RNA binding protein YcfA (HicA-like mRNA interferase family)
MRLPRELSGKELAKALEVVGYAITRQTGSHFRVTTHVNGEHHEVIPNHSSIKIGTLQSILRSVAAHHKLTVAELLKRLDL